MKWQLSPECYKTLKKLDVRIQNSFWQALEVFEKNPDDPTLDHKQLKRSLTGFWKIDITVDDSYAAFYELIEEGSEKIAYFIQVGRKETLYKGS
jgi:mRNA-degrading endonuclease RelE of RelBE toxin-antitoxin system